mgnify:FL=1
MLWIWVTVTVYVSGEIQVNPGTNLQGWASQSECEAALVAEKDFGYTAGWDVVTTDYGTRLVYEQTSMKSVTQCFPVYAKPR